MEDLFPYPVQWHEGMLLSPQHFQRADHRLQCLLKSLCSFFSPFCYGVDLLKVDTAAISAATIRILKVSGIFQDGFSFAYDASCDKPFERNLKEKLASTSENIRIYLAIARYKEGEDLLDGPTPRFISELNKGLKDENLGANPVDFPILKPKLQMLLEEEIDGRYVAFPLLEIRKSETNGIDIVNYIPPTLCLDVHSRIIDLIRDLVSVLRNKINFFSDRNGNASFILGEEVKNNLKTLIQATLELESIIKIDKLPPFTYYQYLLKTSSMLASMNTEQDVPILTAYNHNELFDTFSKLCEFCRKSVNYLKQPFITLPFTLSPDNVFKLMLKEEFLSNEEFIISIRRRNSASDNDLLDWIKGAQIASDNAVSIVKDRRVLGAERRIIERGETVIPPAGAVLLAIKSKSPYVHALENLCIFNIAEGITAPEEIVLYVDK